MEPTDRRPLLVFVAMTLLLDAFAVAAVLSRVLDGRMMDDWFTFYAAGTMLRIGDAARLYDASAQQALQQTLGSSGHTMGYTLPMFAALIFAPLSKLSLNASYVVWFSINVALIGALAWLSWRWLDALPVHVRAVFLVCAVSIIPLEAALLGQVDVLVLAAIVGCYALLRNERPIAGGSLLALALIKPHLAGGVILLLLWKRQWRAIAGVSLTGSALLFGPPLVIDPHTLFDQARLLMSFTTTSTGYGVDATTMINIRGTVVSLTGSSNVWLWLPLLITIGGAAVAIALKVWSRRPALHPQSWALACLLPLLYSPHLHLQSLVLLLPAAALYLVATQASRRPVTKLKDFVYGLVVLLAFWGLVLAGISLMAFLVMAAFSVFAHRWPEPAVAELRTSRQAELALAS